MTDEELSERNKIIHDLTVWDAYLNEMGLFEHFEPGQLQVTLLPELRRLRQERIGQFRPIEAQLNKCKMIITLVYKAIDKFNMFQARGAGVEMEAILKSGQLDGEMIEWLLENGDLIKSIMSPQMSLGLTFATTIWLARENNLAKSEYEKQMRDKMQNPNIDEEEEDDYEYEDGEEEEEAKQ